MGNNEHTFVVCAYGESPYLEECLQSIVAQSIKSNLLMVTSTPNGLIYNLAEKYSVKLCVNYGAKGITQDWNFALRQVQTEYATIAHQDDVYERDYLKSALTRIRESRNPLIAFTDYFEIRDGQRVYKNKMSQVKRLMLFPLKIKLFAGNRRVRRMILAFGDPICCPSVTYCLKRLKHPVFQDGFRSCEDWEAWERISKLEGDFLYVPKRLVGHRIHKGSVTTEIIQGNARKEENYMMFCKFWPSWLARVINHFYTKSEESNQLKK